MQRLAGHTEVQLKNKFKNFVANKLEFCRVEDNIGTAQLAVSSRFH